MLTYNTSLPNAPPVDAASRAAAQATVRSATPYGALGQNHRDVLNALASRQANAVNMEGYKANANYQLQQQQAQRQLALEGLGQMAQAQQNQNSLANTRLQNMVGLASTALRGLFD